ncbi:hypothetical protein HDU67_008600 [Dinochytrium kinnereticum]|nr:hypothetical protein HDU67_008600 [Dinochytrium kinnereticum]
MGITRAVAGLSIPKFLTGSKITAENVEVLESDLLETAIRNVVGLPSRSSSSAVTSTSGDASATHQTSTIRHIGAEWVIHKDLKLTAKPNTQVILYLHGGAHIFMSPRTHRGITSQISKSTGCPILSLDYRLAPESAFPAAIEDTLAAYLSLIDPRYIPNYCTAFNTSKSIAMLGQSGKRPALFLEELEQDVRREPKFNPSQILIAGDSSGGCLTLQILLSLRALGLPLPGGAVLISPFVDNDLNAPSWRRNWNSDFLSLDHRGVAWAMRVVAGNTPLITNSHPIFSPIHADLTGLCPMLIQAGEAEVLTDDALKLHGNAVSSGCKSELQLYKDMFHVFHAFPTVAAAGEAMKRIGIFTRSLKPTGSIDVANEIASVLITPFTSSPPSSPLTKSAKRRMNRKKSKKAATSPPSSPRPAAMQPAEDSDDSCDRSSTSSRTLTSVESSGSLMPGLIQRKMSKDSEIVVADVAVLITVKGKGFKGVDVVEEQIPTVRVGGRVVEVMLPVPAIFA